MHSILNTQKFLVTKTKDIVKGGCCFCQKLNISHTSTNINRLNVHRQFPCPIASSRFLSTSFPIYLYDNYDSRPINSSSIRPFLSPNSSLLQLTQPTTIVVIRNIYVSSRHYDKEPLKPSSKVEETVNALKESAAKSDSTVDVKKPKKSLKTKIVEEIMHYYHGFRLLCVDINVSRKLLWRVLNGKTLTRREHKQLIRTVGDLFRLVPFSVFIIVPFMELLLPVFIKLFPGMLPSTFETTKEKEAKMKQSLKVKIEMAKFLQQTLDEMAVESKEHKSDSAKEIAEFFDKIRSSGSSPPTDEIMKFSKLFEDEITLDSLSRAQLMALCRVLEIQPIGTSPVLRFQLRMRLRSLAADDKMIMKEGIDSLTPWELQQACRARGMRAYGISEAALKRQLAQWLDLSMNEKVPPSLLLMSRALLLPEEVAPHDQLKTTISVLPDTLVSHAKAAVAEREGKISNKEKIALIKEEEKKIQEELQEEMEEMAKQKEKEIKEVLVDRAPAITTEDVGILAAESVTLNKVTEEVSSADLEKLEDALETLTTKKLLVEKEEIDNLKEELQDYKEDVEDLTQVLMSVDKSSTVKESKGAKRLYKKVSSMVNKMDALLEGLEEKEQRLKKDLGGELADKESKEKSEELVTIEELMSAIKNIQKIPDDPLTDKISEILLKMDLDRDGSISVEHLLKVVDLVEKENVKLTKKQMDELLELLKKEEIIELEEEIQKALDKAKLKELEEAKKNVSKDSKEKSNRSKEENEESISESQIPAAAIASTANKPAVEEPKEPNGTSKKVCK